MKWNPLKWFSKEKPQPAKRIMQPVVRGEYIEIGTEGLRRFEAANTNRLNEEWWVYAHSESINVDLWESLDKLQSRCSWEASNNALVAGAIETLACDVWGDEGPTLRVVSDDDAYNNAVEEAWATMWDRPDPAGRVTGLDAGHTWIRSLCTSGSFVNIHTQNPRRPGRVGYGFTPVHCRRLGDPPELTGTPNIAFGQRLDDMGRTLSYFVRNENRYMRGRYDSYSYEEYPAEAVQHRFILHEPEQLTGFPWLTSCLQTVASLRQYDHFVMEAAKLAASSAQSLESFNPEMAVEPEDLTNTTLNWEPSSVNIAPKGWRWVNHTSTQPSTQYREFRNERLRELGLALGMPLMMVLMSSAESNFASAHYDGAVYMRRIKAIQKWISKRTLQEMLGFIITELRLMGVRPKGKFQIVWSWPVPPYVNPEKQRSADRMDLEDGTKSVPELITERGGDPDAVLATREEYAAALEAAGLPPGPDARAAANLVSAEASATQAENQAKQNTQEGKSNDRHVVRF